MNFNFINGDIDKIKKQYEYDQNLSDPSDIFHYNYCSFKDKLVYYYRMDDKFDELKEEIKNSKGTNKAKIKESEENLNKFIKEYKDIVKNAEDHYNLFYVVSGRLKYDYEDNYYQKWAKNLFYQASKEIIDNKVNFYKKSEKKIILIIDLIKELSKSLTI